MKRKPKIRLRRAAPPSDASETTAGPSSALATPGRTSIERVDERKTGSIESAPQVDPENGAGGFIEPDGSDVGSAP